MEVRGQSPGNNSRNSPLAISRRACDQCRVRKVACDRASPCANCVTARVSCTHSAIASSTRSTSAKQRVLISSQYEQKIDDIARGISGINLLLEKLGSPTIARLHNPGQDAFVDVKIDPESLHERGPEPFWNYSAHIAEFVRDFVNDSRKYAHSGMGGIINSLANLAGVIDGSSGVASTIPSRETSSTEDQTLYPQKIPMPPLEDAVTIMRWAKEHETYRGISWLSQLLPLNKWTEICQKVYFAVDDYSDIDFMLANGYLHYVFIEHFFASGTTAYKKYCCLCRFNLESTFRRLPLILPANMETIAALTLGASNSIENGNAMTAWTFVSTAWDLFQRAGYRLSSSTAGQPSSTHPTHESVFWALYELDKGLALRLGRSPMIRDLDISVPSRGILEPRSIRVARIQGKIYEELCSPRGSTRPLEERAYHAEVLSSELRRIIAETNTQLTAAGSQSTDDMMEPLCVLHLRSELVCQFSLLALTLRMTPSATGALSEACMAAAREALRMHQSCINMMQALKGIEYMMERYRNWVILHTPFVSFSILFTHAVDNLDLNELARLDDFASSLGTGPALDPLPPLTHPQRLYELLCQAARLYIYANYEDMTLKHGTLPDALTELEFSQFEDLSALGDLKPSDDLATTTLHAQDDNWFLSRQD